MGKRKVLLIIFMVFSLEAKLENHINKNGWDFIKHKFNINPIKRIRKYESKIIRFPIVVLPGIITGIYADKNNQLIMTRLVSVMEKLNGPLDYWWKWVRLTSISIGLFHSWRIYNYINKYKKNNYQLEEFKDLIEYWNIYKDLCPIELHDFFQKAFDLYHRDIKEFNKLASELLFILNNKIREHE